MFGSFSIFRRSINLDDPILDKLGESFLVDIGTTDPPTMKNPVLTLLSLVLKQSLHDKATCFHMFADTENACVRFLEYRPVPKGWTNGDWAVRNLEVSDTWIFPSAAGDSEQDCGAMKEVSTPEGSAASQSEPGTIQSDWAWCEMWPVPIELSKELFSLIRTRSTIRNGKTKGTLVLLHEENRIRADVVFHAVDDLRLYFAGDRPAVRPKPQRQQVEGKGTH